MLRNWGEGGGDGEIRDGDKGFIVRRQTITGLHVGLCSWVQENQGKFSLSACQENNFFPQPVKRRVTIKDYCYLAGRLPNSCLPSDYLFRTGNLFCGSSGCVGWSYNYYLET